MRISDWSSDVCSSDLKTLACRMRVHDANALRLAEWLNVHPQVEQVFHPGLPGHPGYETARSQMTGFGGMLAFLIRGGRTEAMQLINACRLVNHTNSLGGVDSNIATRASQEVPG